MNLDKRILVVDDEVKIVEVVQSYLEKEGFCVSVAYSGGQALNLFEEFNPSLIVLDLMLPDISGEEVCTIIRKKSRIPIIMLTAKTEEENIITGLNIGADDYVVKPFSPKQLVARIIALLRRTAEADMPLSNILKFNDGEIVIDCLKYEVKLNGEQAKLTPSEYKLLVTLASTPNKIFTRDELMQIAFGDDYNGFDRTIDAHIKNLRHKIEPDIKNPRYVLTAHGIGYKFGGEKFEKN